MVCSWVKSKLSLYLDDQLSPLDVKKMNKHLKYCHSCKQELKELQDVRLLMCSLEDVSPPEDFTNNVMDRVSGQGNRRTALSRFSAYHYLYDIKKVAAVLIGVLLLGNSVVYAFFQEPETYGADEWTFQETDLDLTEEQQIEYYEILSGVLNNPYMHNDGDGAEFMMASETSVIDPEQYDENGSESHRDFNPFLLFNGLYLPFAATTLFFITKRTKGE